MAFIESALHEALCAGNLQLTLWLGWHLELISNYVNCTLQLARRRWFGTRVRSFIWVWQVSELPFSQTRQHICQPNVDARAVAAAIGFVRHIKTYINSRNCQLIGERVSLCDICSDRGNALPACNLNYLHIYKHSPVPLTASAVSQSVCLAVCPIYVNCMELWN